MATRKPPAARGAKLKRSVTGAVRVTRAVTILRPAEELYAFWRKFENLANVVKFPVTITSTSETESHWSVTAPGGKKVEWDAVVTDDQPNERIAWRSREGADIPNRGEVRFVAAPGDDNGTEVIVDVEYVAPGGKVVALLAKLTGKEAGQQVMETLRRFKALQEAGEIPTIEGQSVGGPQGPRKGKK